MLASLNKIQMTIQMIENKSNMNLQIGNRYENNVYVSCNWFVYIYVHVGHG